MRNSISVRPACAGDKDAILAFCQNTFRWGDYVTMVWDYWLQDTRGQMLVGMVDEQPVGLMHVTLLDDGTAWLEGMRVHPAFRRRGVSSAMDALGRAHARERGCRVARLATSVDNLAAQKTLASQGYLRVAQYGEWAAEPICGNLADVRIAYERDLQQMLSLWREFSSNPIVANPEWRWEQLDDARLCLLVSKGVIRIFPRGFAIFLETIDSDSLILHALVGDSQSMRALAQAARVEAHYRGFARVEAMIADDASTDRALSQTGFQRQGGMFIYEQAL